MARSIKAKHFLVLVLVALLIAFFGYYAAFKYQLGSRVKAAWWVKNVYDYKDYVASSIETPKLLIVAGSNALFGIDSAIVEQVTGYPVVNLSVHGAMSAEFLYSKVERHVKPGDIVVMPLELSYYHRAKEGYWFVNNMLAWGWDDYLRKLSVSELCKFISLVPKRRLISGFMRQDGTNPLVDPDDVVKEVESLLASSGERWQGYNYRSLNKYGDFIVDLPPTAKPLGLFRDGNAYLQSGVAPTRMFVDWYRKISELVDRRGGRLIVTWPVTIRNKDFDLTIPAHQKKAEGFRNALAAHGINLRCNPALFNLHVKYFFDTQYHVNKYGALIRSENLAGCVKNTINDESYLPMSYSRANMIVRGQELGFSQKADNMGLLFHRRLKDLQGIRAALGKYYGANKSYPVSEGWDGLFTNWGRAGKDWIPGLAPKYIAELPRDPRMTDKPAAQYIYKSNGKAYKLIAHTPEDCDEVKQLHPEMIDPKRDCRAYGYWSREAANW